MRPPRRPRGCAIAAAPAVLRYGGVGTPVWCGEKRQHLSIYNAHFTAPSRKTLGAPLLRPPIVAEAGYGQIFTLRRRVSRSDPRSVSDSSISGDCARTAARPPEKSPAQSFCSLFQEDLLTRKRDIFFSGRRKNRRSVDVPIFFIPPTL